MSCIQEQPTEGVRPKCQGKWPDQTLDQALGLPEGAGSGQHLASVLQEGRENANIDAGLGFIWRISATASLGVQGMYPLTQSLKRLLPRRVKAAVRALLTPQTCDYYSAKDTIAAAKAAGLSVNEYIQTHIWMTGPMARPTPLEKLAALGGIPLNAPLVVEIGPGSGRDLEQILKDYHPARYQIYEPDDGWRKWLAATYPVQACYSDGMSLQDTATKSANLIHAHGVFVYTPFLVTYRYFQEICRVAAPGAFVMFEIFTEKCFDDDTVANWLASPHRYPQFLSIDYVKQFFNSRGLTFVDSFILPRNPPCRTEYLIFQRL
jgi:hypothetical protein